MATLRTRAQSAGRGMVFWALMMVAMFWGAACLVFTEPLLAQDVEKKAPDPAQVAADAARAKLIAPVPASTADYVFGAEKALPGWEGMKGIGTVKDHFGPGSDALDTQKSEQDGKCMYWPLAGIKRGKYFIGLWTQTNDGRYRTEYSPWSLLATIYLNGWPVRFATTSDPVQVKSGLWLAELQTADAIDLKDGDEISLSGIGDGKYLRLCLYKDVPARGHGVTGQAWGCARACPRRCD